MIDEIRVRNLALIREAGIQPASGLTVLTGETGAGKTALLESCRLLMGMRADKAMVREGEDAAEVQGRFFFPALEPDAVGVEDAHADRGECVVCRSVTKDGRSRVRINGDMASVGQLADAIAPHIDLCSQHDSTTLRCASSHAGLLDAWAEDADLLLEYSRALDAAQDAERELARVRDAATLSNAQLDQARFVLSQIEALDPHPGEYEDMSEQLCRAENSEALARCANGAYESLSGEGGALDRLNSAIASMDEGVRFDEALQQPLASLREAGYILEDAARDILAYRDGIDFDAQTLAQMQERFADYQGLLRSYGPTVDDILAAAEDARRTVSSVDDAELAESRAIAAVNAAEADLARAADALASARMQAAPAFAQEVTSVMSQLEMGSAELICKVEPLPRESWTKSGPADVELMFAPASSMSPRPLARIASGGELSRVMLALHVVMGEHDDTDTLVFDEIDTGLGGATALALADVLRRLAATHQVIVVTHLAQVAARASMHYIVRKSEADGVAETSIEEVQGEARTAEIARMLAGSVTEASVTHAKELLNA